MARTDWSLNGTVQPQDMNAIGEEINQLREDVDHIEIPSASVTEAGIVKLSNATNSTSETLAATPRAVNSAYDAATAAQTTANAANTAAATAQARADSAFQLGNERKAEVVAALVAKGISASTSESWDSLIVKLNSIVKATGNAVTADVLSGRTFSNAGANNLIGSMPNRGSGGTVTPGTTNQTKAAGYYSSAITIAGDSNLVADNIKSGIKIFDVVGNLQPKRYHEVKLGTMAYNSSITVTIPFDPMIASVIGTQNPDPTDYGLSVTLSVIANYPYSVYGGRVKESILGSNGFVGIRDNTGNSRLPLSRNLEVFTNNSYAYNVVLRVFG
ncbi:Phage tail fiber repeat protein [compost metagenome]